MVERIPSGGWKVSSLLLLLTTALTTLLSGAEIVFEEPRTERLGHVPEAIAIDDIDGDGRLDAAIANSSADGESGGDSVTILLGNKDGSLTASGTFTAGKRPEGILLLRANGDQDPDIVTANFAGNSVSVLLGDGAGKFAAPAVITVAGGPRYVVSSDFTGDGKADLATANFNGDSVTVLQGNGKGGFVPIRTVAVKDGPEVLALARLDDDPDIDLVTANSRHNSISPLAGDGKGNFSLKPYHRVGMRPRFVLARDLDGDGLDDLIVANHDEDTISVVRNKGGYAFEEVRRLTSPGLLRPVYLDLADVDGNGAPDLLVTWAESDRFSYFPGSGDFAFDSPTTVRAGTHPVGIAAADFDGDGDRDVLVTNALEDTSHFYRVRAARPPVLTFRRGDANADTLTNLSDAIYVLTFLFRGGERPGCLLSADVNRSGSINISDPVYLLVHLVAGGPAPPPPFGSCGEDPEPSAVSCESSPCSLPIGPPR